MPRLSRESSANNMSACRQTAGTRLLLQLFAILMTFTVNDAFLPEPIRSYSSKYSSLSTATASSLQAAKGFGSESKKAKAAAVAAAAEAAKPKSAVAVKRSEASDTLEKQVKAGVPEFTVFARPFGGSEKDWKSVGSIACPRTERPDDVIFKNEEALVSGLFKLFPQMKKEGENFEYGFRLKKFPDDEIRLAFKRTGKSENPIMNWFGSLSNPVNTDNY